MSLRTVGGAAILAVALTTVPTGGDSVAPAATVKPDAVLCDKATAATVYPDTPEMRETANRDCAARFAADTIDRIARGLGMEGASS